jgi:hypothetical protein
VVALTAAGTLATAAVVAEAVAAALVGSATLTVGGVRVVVAAVSLTATSTLLVAAIGQQAVAVALVGTATLTAGGVRERVAQVAMTAAAALSVAAVRDVPAVGMLSVSSMFVVLVEVWKTAAVMMYGDASLQVFPTDTQFEGWGVPV